MNEKTLVSKRNIAIVVIVIAVLAVAYVLFGGTQFADGKVIVRVGEEVITEHDIDIHTRQIIVQSLDGGLTTPEGALFDRSIDDLINESLLFQDALREGFSVNEEEVERRYELARSSFDSERAFISRMKENLLTPNEFRENIGRQDVLFRYLEELKRMEIQAVIEDSIGGNQTEGGVSIEIEAERVPVTQEDIIRLTDKRVEELKEEFKVELFLD